MTLGTESGMFSLPPESKEQIEERIGSPFHAPLEGETLETASKVIDLMSALKESLAAPELPDANCFTLPNGECVSPLQCMHTPPAEQLVADVHEDSSVLVVHRLDSPQDTREWKVERQDGIETFLSPDGVPYVRARTDEGADLIISFTRTRGLTPLRLVRSDQSLTVRRAEKKARREKRELQKRGYDVEE